MFSLKDAIFFLSYEDEKGGKGHATSLVRYRMKNQIVSNFNEWVHNKTIELERKHQVKITIKTIKLIR